MLFLHGTRDPIVPLSEGRRLFDAAREPKEFVELPVSGHTVAVDTQLGRSRLVGFFERCLAGEGVSAGAREIR